MIEFVQSLFLLSINYDIVIQRHQLFQKCGLRHAAHFFLVMPFEQVVDFFGGNRQILTIIILKEKIVILESEIAVLVLVDASEAVADINLAQLVFAMHL